MNFSNSEQKEIPFKPRGFAYLILDSWNSLGRKVPKDSQVNLRLATSGHWHKFIQRRITLLVLSFQTGFHFLP